MKMNRAYSMHAEQLKARKRESIRDPITDEGIWLGARDLSIADIFNDKREQDLFVNHFLPSQDKESARDIVELRRENRALSEQQEQFLEEARIAYNRLRAQAEQVQKHSITDETFIKAVASASPNEIKRNLQLAVSTQLTGWRAAFSFIVKRYRADKLYASFEEQQ